MRIFLRIFESPDYDHVTYEAYRVTALSAGIIPGLPRSLYADVKSSHLTYLFHRVGEVWAGTFEVFLKIILSSEGPLRSRG